MQKKIMLRIFLAAEVVIFGWFYYQGARGVHAVQILRKENEKIAQQIVHVQEEVETIGCQIVAWKGDPFFKEKIAREQLHMAHAGDVIYFFD